MFLYISIVWLLICLTESLCSLPYDNVTHTNMYGADYGTKWIFLPDGDGKPHYVDLRRHDYYNNMQDYRATTPMDIEFTLYLGNSTESPITLNEFAQPIEEKLKNMTITLDDKPLKIITHGWFSSVEHEAVVILKKAYLELQTVNVITIDWRGIAESIFYHWVANETKGIGAIVAIFIEELHNHYNVTGKQLHLLGHSLGAHVMGIAAARCNFTIDRITGLDPARPLFEYPLSENLAKLDETDADFVDVIHTCSGVLGFETTSGTVDFYPNNGIPPQPGCESLQKIFEACSHGRSFQFYTESIKYPFAFPTYQCLNWTNYLNSKCDSFGFMGESVDRTMSGKYYLKTNGYRPYGFGTVQFCTRCEMELTEDDKLLCSELSDERAPGPEQCIFAETYNITKYTDGFN